MSTGSKTDFAGRDGFSWWIGEVEDNMDPTQMGRVKVRIIGWYTGNRVKDGASSYLLDMPTEVLPWATVLLPTDRPQTKNAGSTTELQPGAQVLGFFLDGDEAQLPCVLGAFRGFRHAEGANEGSSGGKERGSADEMSRTLVADSKVANKLATDTPQQKGLNNQNSMGGHQFVKAQGQTPGSAEGGEETSRGAISRPEEETPFNVYTNPIGPPSMPGGIADGTTGPANNGFTLDVKRMLTDIGIEIGGLAKDSDGNFLSTISGRVIQGKQILNQISNLTNYLTNAISGILAPLKEMAARVIQQAIDAILTVLSNIIPVVIVRLVGEILELIFQLFCKPTPEWVNIMKDVLGYVTSYLDNIFNQVMDFINEIEARIIDFVEKAMSGIQNAICKGLTAINRIADGILQGIQVAKAAGKFADGVSSIFALDFTKINFTSVLSILKAILSLIVGLKDCGRRSRKPRATMWLPLLGTTECASIDPNLQGPGGKSCSPTTNNLSGGNFFDKFFQNINPFLAEVKTSLNGTREINDATPGKEKRVISGPGAVTTFEDKNGNMHKNTPNNDTKIIGRDYCVNVKNNHVMTIEGDYYLKVMGDFHLEVAGSFNKHESNGPGAVARDSSGKFKGGQSWLDQGKDNGGPAKVSVSGGNFGVEHGEKEAKSTNTTAGDHDINYQGDIKMQANRINLTGISAINLKSQEINNQAGVINNEAHGEIINESNWITSFLNCGRFDMIGLFQLMPVVTGQFSIVKGSIVDVAMDLPFPGAAPPAQVRMCVGSSRPAAMADIVTGTSAGGHMTMVATPTGGIGEVVTAGSGAIINQVTTGVISHGVGVGFAAFGCALGPTQIYGLPVMLN